ncbi:MAG TPA: hypothetical protein VKO87_10525 [Gemmatimonadaceae bacterium]|nr:hypothetical protein [Gemmatimonadaceae bacterium]
MMAVSLVVAIMACSKGAAANGTDSVAMSATPSASESASQSASATEASGPIKLSAADLDGFEKGFAREIELVRAAAEQARTAKTPAERGKAIQAGWETATIPAAATVTGLSVERYRQVREAMTNLLRMLDFQGKIEGPMSIDTSRVDAEMKAKLASDPYLVFDASSAAAVKARMDRLAPLWVNYVNLTAVGDG